MFHRPDTISAVPGFQGISPLQKDRDGTVVFDPNGGAIASALPANIHVPQDNRSHGILQNRDRRSGIAPSAAYIAPIGAGQDDAVLRRVVGVGNAVDGVAVRPDHHHGGNGGQVDDDLPGGARFQFVINGEVGADAAAVNDGSNPN